MAKETSQKIPYYRILEIDAEIAARHYPNSVSLAKKLEVRSKNTIKRDIAFMRDLLNAPIEYDKCKNGYYYKNETFRLPAIFVSEEEIIAGAIVEKLLLQYKYLHLYKHVKNVFGHFNKALYNKNIVENCIMIMEEDVPNKSDKTLAILIEAIAKRYFITFKYKGHNKDNYIAPYQLLLKSGNWILFGYNNNTKKLKLYNLKYIKSIDITGEHFKRNKNVMLYKSTDKI